MIVVNDPEHGRLLQREGRPFIPGYDHCITRTGNDGRLLGGVVFQNYQKRSIEIHVHSFDRRWGGKEMLWAAFDYPFNQLGVEKIIGFVPSTNRQALDFDLHVGFSIETIIRDVVPGGHLVVVSMIRQQCRWLKLPHRGQGRKVSNGQQLPAPTAELSADR